jgi:hypothetical protein
MGDVTEGPWNENDPTQGAVEFYSGIGGWSEALEGALRRLGREGAFQVRRLCDQICCIPRTPFSCYICIMISYGINTCDTMLRAFNLMPFVSFAHAR